MRKTFVLDTNVLLHDEGALDAFGEHDVVITLDVLEELDRFKTHRDELGRVARHVVRRLDGLRLLGCLNEGVPLSGGGRLMVRFGEKGDNLPPAMDRAIPDNRIIATALRLRDEEGREVTFVSKDVNARVKSDTLGLHAEDYESRRIDFDELYDGYRAIPLPSDRIDAFYKGEAIEAPDDMMPNELALLQDEANPKHTALARHDRAGGRLAPLRFEEAQPWKLRPLNLQQHFAVELLLDPTIQLVTLIGKAGTGKTLLALAAGLEQVAERSVYKRILVSRPIMPLGKDIGYLPGSKEEKLESWMEPIFDNLKFLVDPLLEGAESKVDYLFEKEWIEVEAMTYIRGRSLPKLFIIVDEAQNLSPHEVKTIVSRAGHETKVVLTGDPYQIDNPYLDASSNGLTTLVERFRAQPLFGHITLTRSERSDLASLAAELL
jgi:PhoH-like ATPase